MAKHMWAILCRSVSIDKDSNNISLFNVVEQLGLPPEILAKSEEKEQRILAAIELAFVVATSRSDPDEPESIAVRVTILAPDGSELGQSDFTSDLTAVVRNRAKLAIEGMPLKGVGTYQFRVEYQDVGTQEWTEVAELPLQIAEMRPSAQEAEA